MSGYTPLFDSLTRGTLCGRWPDIGLWPIVLSLSDKNGIVDVTPLYIAGITGLPVEEVIACMKRFCEPDEYSRSKDHGGCRLVLLDDHREWGWRIVNHGKYRERARLAAKNSREVESGREAERKRHARQECPPVSAEVRRSPPVSDPSNANANTNANTKGESAREARTRPRKRCPENFEVTEDLQAWAREKFPDVDINAETEAFRDHEFATAHGDWPATWRSWIRKAAKFNGTGQRGPARRLTKYEQVMEALGDD